MASRFKDLELGLENGVTISEDNRISLSRDASNSGRVHVVNLRLVTSMNVEGQLENKDGKQNKVVKEKRKSLGCKKPPKPPRAPRAPSLDAADQKLIREIAELAMLRRARIERIKALKKSKAAKPVSSNSNMFALVFTLIFCLVIMFQGMAPGGTPASYQGSPLPAGAVEGGPSPLQFSGNQPNSESPYLEEQVAGLEAQAMQQNVVSNPWSSNKINGV